ncbi:MAG: response regulator [Comamonadaceae bacterium]|nr:response regulator [Comamonadaceae bacterium]
MNEPALSVPRSTASAGTVLQRSVAIVDDDPQISQALGQWVELRGLQALRFTCAECLLKALAPDKPPLTVGPTRQNSSSSALVAGILDLNLPGLSGMALAHLLRSMDANLPLVVVTALRQDERRHYGQLPAGVPCLQKPFDLDALEDALFPISP